MGLTDTVSLITQLKSSNDLVHCAGLGWIKWSLIVEYSWLEFHKVIWRIEDIWSQDEIRWVKLPKWWDKLEEWGKVFYNLTKSVEETKGQNQ